jgi:hypothetical protein
VQDVFLLLILALHIICAIEIVRNGDTIPWIFFILAAPVIGCVIYLTLISGPELLAIGARTARRLRMAIDPERDLRGRQHQAELVGSAEARRALAEACIKQSRFEEAAALFETAAMGPHADDPVLLHGLAHARFLNNDPAGAQAALDHLRAANPHWRSAKAHLLYARTLEQQSQWAEALAEYEALVDDYPGEEARCRYALLLQRQGRAPEARALFETVMQSVDGAPKHYRRAQNAWAKLARRNLSA